ncbi:hypothetical protein SBOR_8713 [Sclerotinia borealis F-4128]|uniref:L-ornithine N(5)-monooxygenase [NAD(P)H] n=1 Tax=Sclerotinia borealis (strain F-4128) TaxID=1432307 RepID=W9C4W5_SCLBF|nr:hypothetical protein SBOR_8713 [Sclerotinia borealis F-4128]
MSLQTPIYEHPQPTLPLPHPHLTNRVRAYDIISTKYSIAQLSLAITTTVRRSPLSILFLNHTPELEMACLNHEAIFMQDFATNLDPTCRYTFLNYLSEEGMLGEWMAKGDIKPSGEEWAGYVGWCAKVVREEGWVDFCEGSVEGIEERGNGRAVDVMVSGELFKADRVLNGGEEILASTDDNEELDILQATNTLQHLCAASSLFNLAALTTENELRLAQYEQEHACRMVDLVSDYDMRYELELELEVLQ